MKLTVLQARRSEKRAEKTELLKKGRGDHQNDKSFCFMDLSAELRNQIYDLSLITPKPILIRTAIVQNRDHVIYTWKQDPSLLKKASLSPNLLSTCKKINDEATAILYGANHFNLRISQFDSPSISWLGHIGNSIAHIRVLEIHNTIDQTHAQGPRRQQHVSSGAQGEMCGQLPGQQDYGYGALSFGSEASSGSEGCEWSEECVRCFPCVGFRNGGKAYTRYGGSQGHSGEEIGRL